MWFTTEYVSIRGMTDVRQGADAYEAAGNVPDEEPAGLENGFTVLDGVAVVIAAAVASLHLRTPMIRALGASSGLLWITFAGVAISAAGPVLLIMRRYGRRPLGYPRLGDRLWALLGSPWILTAMLRPASLGEGNGSISLYGTILTIAVGITSLLVLVIMWKVWVLKPPGSRVPARGPVPWTERLGMAVSVAWPLQSAFLLIVLDSETMPPGP